MKFSILALVTAAASGVLAAPATEVSAIEARYNGYMSLCTSLNLQGDCGNIASNNRCFNVKKNDQASSFYLKNAQCNIYEDSNCKGRKATIRSGPKESVNWNLALVKHGLNWLAPKYENWDNRVSSVICWDY